MSNRIGRKIKRSKEKKSVTSQELDQMAAKFVKTEMLPWMKEHHDNAPNNSCTLCGSPEVSYAGYSFISSAEAHRFGGIPGRPRYLGFTLCAQCEKDPTWDDKVDEVLARDIDEVIRIAVNQPGMPLCALCQNLADMLHAHPGKKVVFGTCQRCREARKHIWKDLDRILS